MALLLKVSSKGRYGVKAVFEIAQRYGQGPVTVGVIAHAQNIPEQYLEQLMPALKRAQIVKGLRGAQGGYMLAKSPDLISVKDVVEAVEGPIIVADCSTEDASGCDEMGKCIGPDVWTRVQEAVVEAMGSMTFQKLLAAQRGHAIKKLALFGGGG